MTACTACGHDQVRGQVCPECGHAAAATGTAPPPPVPGSVPPPARFPMFADEAPSPGEPAEPDASPPALTLEEAPATPDEPPPLPPPGTHAGPRQSAGPLPWIVGVAVMLIFAVVGGLLLTGGGGGDEQTATDPDGASEAADTDDGSDSDESEPPAEPEDDADDTGTGARGPGAPVPPTRVDVPGSAPDSRDNSGSAVTFGADNLFDGDPDTSWRVRGDASGERLRFAFDEPVTLAEVGIVNGYAKNDPPNDWYTANRRVLEVTWTFDDGTTVAQDLAEDRAMQTMEVDAGETSSVTLEIVRVSTPGGRNYTAISEVALVGAAG